MPAKKYLHPLGFLGTGVVGRSFLAGLPSLKELLGPVYSPTKRVTPRLVHSMGAGFSVATMKEVQKCQSLLVCAPPEETASLLREAREEGVLDRVDTLALVEHSAHCLLDPEIAGCVREAGFISKLPLRKEPTYLVEGSMRFRRFCQTLLQAPLRRLVLIPRESRAVMDAAVFMAEEFCLPLFEVVQSSIVLAGVAPDHARDLAAELLLESLRSAHFAGRKRWTGILHTEDEQKLSRIVEALRRENELLASLAVHYIHHGLAAMGKRTDWIPRPPAASSETAPPDKAETATVPDTGPGEAASPGAEE